MVKQYEAIIVTPARSTGELGSKYMDSTKLVVQQFNNHADSNMIYTHHRRDNTHKYMYKLTGALGLGGLMDVHDGGPDDSCGGVLPNELNLLGVLGGSEVGDKVDGLVH